MRNPVDDGEREIDMNRSILKPLELTQLSCELGFNHPEVHIKKET